jgi:ABC-2 type transport system permease protein
MPQADAVFRHRTPHGTFLGGADGRPLPLGRLRHLIIELSEHRHALSVFTVSRFRATYRAQALGLLWPVANPTILMIVMSVFFGLIFPPDVKAYPVFLLLGLVPWHFLSHAWTDGTTCLLQHAAVIKRTSVPAYVVVAGTVFSHTFNLGFASLSLLPLIAFYPEAFQVSFAMLALPVVVALLVCLGLGLALLSSILNVVYRDVGYIVNSVLLVLFWATPIIYPLHKVPDAYQGWMMLNPMASLIHCIRAIIIEGAFPPGRAFWPALAVSLGVLLLGALVYRRFSSVVADHV